MVDQRPTQTWNNIAKAAATQMSISPIIVPHIEARGNLCHELLILMGGHVEFVATPISSLLLRALEFVLPISPICRWTPPERSRLEQIGRHRDQDTVVYRLRPEAGDTAVFFIRNKPEPTIGGSYVRTPFHVPQLDLAQFLRPPFTPGYTERLEDMLRLGMIARFSPSLLTNGASDHLAIQHAHMCQAMWEVLAIG